MTMTEMGSRAVVRRIGPGNWVECAGGVCLHPKRMLKFEARKKDSQIVCNVYEDGSWRRVEHYHPDCYEVAGRPHGSPAS